MEQYTRKKPRCINCVFYEKQGKTTGYCSRLKVLSNYRFSYDEENANDNTLPPPIKPIVHRFAICNNWIDRRNKANMVYNLNSF